ncbi:hypothetical protein ACFY7Y_37895 [Streptomyces virginiae]
MGTLANGEVPELAALAFVAVPLPSGRLPASENFTAYGRTSSGSGHP